MAKMAENKDIYELLKTEDRLRDEAWEAAFLAALPGARLKVLNQAPQQGPDGWPYLMVQVEPEGAEPALKVLQWLTETGIGLVINPKMPTPDFVLSFGMIWNYRETGQFVAPEALNSQQGPTEFSAGTKVLAGEPSEKYLPPYVRQILREFFRQQQKEAVKILVMSEDQKHFDLCFSLESLGTPPRHEHHGILETISWFLPPHYSLVLASEEGLPRFFDL